MNPLARHPAVRRMLELIEQSLRRTLTLRELARAAGLSPWHASRLFRGETGLPPLAYLRKRRLSAAADQLDGPGPIIDVAFDFVFDSHEGFTRAFARHFGMTPREYRGRRPPVPKFLPEQMRAHYQSPRTGDGSMAAQDAIFVQVVERPARRLLLKRGVKATHYFEYCEEVGCQVWEELGQVADALHEPMGLWLPESWIRPGTSRYVQGVEVARDWAGEPGAGYELIDLPACLWMVFQGPPFADEDYAEAIGALVERIRAYDPAPYGFQWADEAGPRFQLEPLGHRGYIEGRPVRRIEG